MLLQGKNGLILGVANKRSIAWGIARACAREGARLALTYQGDRLKENVDELSKELSDPLLYSCDVAKDEDIAALAASVKADLGHLDFVVHSVAFAASAAGRFIAGSMITRPRMLSGRSSRIRLQTATWPSYSSP